MALYIDDLNYYDIVELKDGTEIKIPCGAFSYGPDILKLTIFPEGRTVEEVEELFKHSTNLTLITIYDRYKEGIRGRFNNYTVLHNIQKAYKGVYHTGYDENGNYYELTMDLYRVELRPQNADDKIPQMEATMEYIAIMADIDIDEE